MKVRKATVEDIPQIKNLFKKESGRDLSNDIKKYILEYPSSILLEKETVFGFCYSKPFAPDIIEILNIFIEKNSRGNGFGKLLIKEVEKQSLSKFNAIILINSLLYQSNEVKRLAITFYLDCGFKSLLSTTSSKVYGKELQ